jgi:nuclear pore complex protein Nup107
MADRVGKEVEKFAQRVDTWHTQIHENESANAKYHSTLQVIGEFKDIANKTAKELKKQSEAENKAQLQKSVMRRIETDVVEDLSESENEGTGSFRSIVPSVETSSIPPSTIVKELRQWQTEAATWDLLQTIITHQYPEPGKDVVSGKRSQLANVGGTHRYSPNSEIWDRFLLEDDHAKEKELVLRWLERCARDHQEDIETITEGLEEKSGKGIHTWTSGWLDTKSIIKQAKRMQGREGPLSADFDGLKNRSRTQTLISQLDPDAPGRQKRWLEESDEFYDRALWMVCYEMLRRGAPWEDIAEWCKERNESWRGISIGAAYESHPDGGPNVSGPTVGYLFRRMCYYAANGARGNHEAAVYGLLSGDLDSIEDVCRSWDSQLYARCNALLLSRFDGYLLKNHSHRIPETIAHKFAFSDAVANIGDWQTSSHTVIKELKKLKANGISDQALSPMKLIQGSLIDKTIRDLIFQVGVAIAIMLQGDDRPTSLVLDPEVQSGETEPRRKIPLAEREHKAEKYHETLASDPHALRVLVHTFIVLRQGLGVINAKKYPEWAALDNVIAAYIEFLRMSKRIGLIPIYAAQLHGDRRKHCVARVLPEIKNFEEQSEFVGLMNTYQIKPVEVISWNYTLTAEREFSNKADYISKYDMLEPVVDAKFGYLWPSKRLKLEFAGLEVQPKEGALVDTLRWHIHLTKDIKHTFNNLHSALICLLRKFYL